MHRDSYSPDNLKKQKYGEGLSGMKSSRNQESPKKGGNQSSKNNDSRNRANTFNSSPMGN